MPLELTTTIRRVSSSPKARSGLSPAAAAGRAVASIRYITRSTAAEAVEWSGARLDAVAPKGHRAVKAALAEAIQERAQEGGKQGRVIAGRFIVSLPNDWPLDARREALRRVCAHLAPPGSDALAMGALHNDKPDNPHMHILAVDGLEAPNWPAPVPTPDAPTCPRFAAQGRPGATPRRPASERPQTPQELRRDIAAILNDIAQREGGGRRMAVLRGTGHRPPRHEARRPGEARTAAEAGRGRAAHRLHPAPAQAAHRPAYTARPAHPAPADGQRSTGRTRTRSQALFGLHPRREAPAYVCHPPDRARPGSPRYPGRRRQGRLAPLPHQPSHPRRAR